MPKSRASAAGCCQPRALTSLARTAPNGCGSRGSGPGPGVAAQPPSRSPARAAPARRGAGAARLARAASSTARASSGPGRSAVRRLGRGHAVGPGRPPLVGSLSHGAPRPSPTAYRAPAQRRPARPPRPRRSPAPGSPPPTISASRSRRPVSSSAKTSSSTSTGSIPSPRSSSNAASRSASANDHDSPWLAYPLAGSSPRVSVDVVAVRADERDATLHLGRSRRRQRRQPARASIAARSRSTGGRSAQDLASYAMRASPRPALTASYALATWVASAAHRSSRPAIRSAPCCARCASQTSSVDRSPVRPPCRRPCGPGRRYAAGRCAA